MGKKEWRMRLRGAIFDLDGVLVDTVPLHFKAWKKMFSEYGHEFSFDDYRQKVDGIPRSDGAKAILNDLTDEEIKKAAAKKQRYFLELLHKEGLQVYKSTVDLISSLKNKGIGVAVISSSKNCLDILKKAGLDNAFDAVVSGNDIEKGKPAPDIFLSACAKLNLTPPECIVFEDAYLGVEAAKKGNFICVGVDRYDNPRRLSKADLIVKDLSEVKLDTIKKLFQ